VVAAEHPLLDREGPPVQLTGVRRLAAALFEGGEAGEVEADLEAGRTEDAPEHREGAAVELGRLAQPPPRLHDGGQGGDVGGDRRMPRAEEGGAQPNRPARVRLGAGEVAAGVLDAAEVVGQRRERVPIAARHEGQGAPVEGQRFGVTPLRLAQHAEVVEHAGEVAIARAETAPHLGERDPVAAVGGGVGAHRAIDPAQRGARPDAQAGDVGVARSQVGPIAQDIERAPLAAGRLAEAIARLQDQAQLDERIRDVGVAGPLDGLVAGDRLPAGALRRLEASVRAQRDRPLVRPDGPGQWIFDGCLRPGIVPFRPGMSSRARASVPGRRRFLAPEVIQTSAMDCGPAALKCLLEGFGVSVSYGRLREACQTSVDGTSIDTLETLAQSLGLDAEQVMMPVDHLLLAESDALPAIVVVRLPSGLTHFVVVWRAHGGWVQVMDPARGRRWVRRAAFLRDVYVHSLALPADAFREWAGSDGFTAPLERRLRALGIHEGGPLVARALEDSGWSSIAALDRAVRAVAELAAAGAVTPGPEARRLVDALATGDGPPGTAHATATAAPPADDGSAQVRVRGAVLLRVAAAAPLDADRRAELPVELRAAVDEPPVRVGAALWRLVREGDRKSVV